MIVFQITAGGYSFWKKRRGFFSANGLCISAFPGHEKVHPIRKSNSNGVKIVDGVPKGWERIKFKDIISTIESGRPKVVAIDGESLQ